MPSPFAGAWPEVSETGEAYRLFTDAHFSHIGAPNGRKAISGQLSDEDAAALFQGLAANAGTHTLTAKGAAWERFRTLEIAARPAAVGREATQTWTFGGNRVVEQFLEPDGTPGRVVVSERISDPGSTVFAGAWELVSDAYEGLMVCSDSHYCAVVTRRERPIPQGTELSVAEAAGLYRALQTAVAGTYTIDGMKTTTRALLDRNLAMIGRESTREWRFEDDRAIGVPVGGGEQVVWRRIG